MDKSIAEKFKQGFIKSFIESEDFDEANAKAERLKALAPFSGEQCNEIIFGYLSNNQVNGSWRGKSFVRNLVEENKTKINLVLLSLYNDYEKHGDYALDTNRSLLRMYIQAIIKQRPNLAPEAIQNLVLKEKENGLSTFTALFRVTENLEIKDFEIESIKRISLQVDLPEEMEKELRNSRKRIIVSKKEENEFYVAGTGLVAGKDVEVHLDKVADNVPLAIITARPDGTWKGLIEIPPETTKGTHYLWSKDLTTNVVEKAQIELE